MLFKRKKSQGFTVFELAVSFCLIFIFIGVFLAYANTTLTVAKDVALRNELAHIRMAIEHYRIVNNEYPQELADLTKEYLPDENSVSIIMANTYLKPARVSKEGDLLDPFGAKYEYDYETGRVWTLSANHQSW